MEEKETISRRALLKAMAAGGVAGALGSLAAPAAAEAAEAPEAAEAADNAGGVEWVATTRKEAWRRPVRGATVGPFKGWLAMDVMLLEDTRFQTIEGFGACFNELGWKALSRMPEPARQAMMRELFAPGVGLNLNLCRMPIGANDFAREWYSYNETAGDFAMAKFDLARDDQMQVPFIRAAQRQRPDLKLWASPWSPPTWMKRNGHYAMAPSFPGAPPNGLEPEQVGTPGQDMFIQEERYFEAYALYFRKFVEAYAQRGIKISAVMPQNEFNSAQPFPSCLWTPRGLARFIPYLGRQMDALGVEVFFGTLERGDPAMFEAVLAQPEAARHIKGIGAQWAGRRAIPFIHHAHPELRVYQSEQECGDGKNDWRFARYTWTLMKDFMRAGANAYMYWNIATPRGGASTWGWPQNALVSVDMASGRHTVNPDFHVFKHLSHHVRPGAQRIDTLSISGYENLLAFRNPDGRIVVVAQNDMAEPQTLRIAVGTGKLVSATLPADSFNTLVI